MPQSPPGPPAAVESVAVLALAPRMDMTITPTPDETARFKAAKPAMVRKSMPLSFLNNDVQ